MAVSPVGGVGGVGSVYGLLNQQAAKPSGGGGNALSLFGMHIPMPNIGLGSFLSGLAHTPLGLAKTFIDFTTGNVPALASDAEATGRYIAQGGLILAKSNPLIAVPVVAADVIGGPSNPINNAFNALGNTIGTGNVYTPPEAVFNPKSPGLLPVVANAVSTGAALAGVAEGAASGVAEGAAESAGEGEAAAGASRGISGAIGRQVGKFVSPETGQAAANFAEKIEPFAHPYRELFANLSEKVGGALSKFQDEQVIRDATTAPPRFEPGDEATIHNPDGTSTPATVLGDAGVRNGVPHYMTDATDQPVPVDQMSRATDETTTPTPTEWKITEALKNSSIPAAQVAGRITEAADSGAVKSLSKIAGFAQRRATSNEVFKQKALARMETMKALLQPDMRAAQRAADIITKEHGIDPDSALQMTGRLIRQRGDAVGLLDEELRGRVPDQILGQVRHGELDVPKEVREDPKVRAAVDEAISYYRDSRLPENLQRMTEGRLGDKGLEYTQSDEPLWTAPQKRASALIDKLRAQIGKLDEDRIPVERARQARKVENIKAVLDRQDRKIKGVHDARIAVESKIAADRQAMWDREAQGVAAREDAAAVRELKGKELEAHRTTRQLEETAKEWDRTYTAARNEALAGGQYRYKFDPDEDPAISWIKDRADNAVERWADAYQQEMQAFRQRREAELGATPKPKPEGVRSAYSRGLNAEKRRALAGRELELIRQRRAIQKSLDESQRVLDEHLTKSEVVRKGLEKKAVKGEAALKYAREHPPTPTVAARWQPIYKSVRELHAMALENPDLRTITDALPESLPQIINWIHSKGYDPVYLSNLTGSQVTKLLRDSDPFIGTDLGKETSASTRKLRNLSSDWGRDDSPASVLAGADLARIRETAVNSIVDYLERHIVRDTPQGDHPGEYKVPRNWRAWDEHKYGFINAHRSPDDQVAVTAGAEKMIPKSVANFMDEWSKSYSHWLTRVAGKAMNVINTLLIRWNPAFYAYHFVRMLATAMVGGASLKDFYHSWQAIREGRVPELAHEYLVLDRNTGGIDTRHLTARQAFSEKWADTHNPIAATHAAAARVMGNIDQWARTAVYLHKVETEGLSHEQALLEANDALIDFRRLSPFEQAITRNAILFYAIRKGVFKIISKMPLDHPLAWSLLQGLNQIGEQKQKDDYGINLPSAYWGLGNIFGLNVNLTTLNPFRDAEGLTTPQGLYQALNPLLQAIINEGTGTGVSQPTGYAMGPTGQLIPQRGLLQELGDQLLRTPDMALIQGLAGAGTKGPLQSLGNFLGLKTLTDQQVKTLVTRTLENTAKQTVGPQPFGTTVKQITTAAQPIMAANGTINQDALQAAFGTSSIADLVKQRNTALSQAQGTSKTTFGGGRTKAGSSSGRRRGGVSKARIHKASVKRGGHVHKATIHKASVKARAGRKSSVKIPRLHIKTSRKSSGGLGGQKIGKVRGQRIGRARV